MSHQIGTLLRVSNASEARQAFQDISGLGGAIWQDIPAHDYVFPDEALQSYLARNSYITWDCEKGITSEDTAAAKKNCLPI